MSNKLDQLKANVAQYHDETEQASPEQLKKEVRDLKLYQVELEAQLNSLVTQGAEPASDIHTITNLLDHLPIGYLVVSNFERIVQINGHAKRFLNVGAQPVHNRSLFSLFENKKQGMQVIRWLTQRGEALSLRLSHGERVRSLSFEKTEIAPREFIIIIRDDSQQVESAVKQVNELNQAKQRERALQNYILQLTHNINVALESAEQTDSLHTSVLSMMAHLRDTEQFFTLLSGAFVARRSNVCLEKILEKSVAARQSSTAPILLTTSRQSNDKVLADSSLLTTLVENLMEHAIEANEHGAITIEYDDHIVAHKSTKIIELSVEYNTSSESLESLEMLLDPVFGSTPSVSMKLSLAIAEQITRLFDNKLRLEVDAGNGTATVKISTRVELPLASEKTELTEREIISAPDLTGSVVMLVDDNPAFLEVLKLELEPTKARIDKFTSAAKALDELNYFRPDMILTDIVMPDIDGIQFSRYLRQRGFKQPVVAITGDNSEKRIAMLERAGFTAVLSKPTSPCDLYRMLEKLCHV